MRELGFQVGRIHRVVQAVRDAEVGELAGGQRLGGAVGVVGNQHLVAGLQERERDQRDRGQPAGHEQAFGAAFERGQAFFEREGGGRAVQAVGVAGLGLPVARAHGGDVGEEHGRGLEHAGLRRSEGGRRRVGMVDQGRGRLAHVPMLAPREEPSTAVTFSVRCRRPWPDRTRIADRVAPPKIKGGFSRCVICSSPSRPLRPCPPAAA
ncbi:hypothetical protein D3C72_1529710 [compost metagenome]